MKTPQFRIVTEQKTIDEALALISTTSYDLVLLDETILKPEDSDKVKELVTSVKMGAVLCLLYRNDEAKIEVVKGLGLRDYVLSSLTVETFVNGIEAAVEGLNYEEKDFVLW